MTGEAGWHQQPDGSYRYWNGQRWSTTDSEFRRNQTNPGNGAKPSRAGLPAWSWVAMGLGTVVLGLGGLSLVGNTIEPAANVSGTGESSSAEAARPTTATPSTTSDSSPKPKASTPASTPPSSALPPAPVLPNPPTALAVPTGSPVVAVTRVVDGDTIETSLGTIRLIGIDTPERGECNYDTATAELEGALAAHGNQVVLAAGATDDSDRYGRLLRYVDTPSGEDLNLHMINTGLANARYDSRDGYGRHPRETSYVAADAVNAAPGCAPVPVPSTPPPAPPPPAQVPPAPLAAPVGEPWNRPGPPDLDCSDIGQRVFITGPDYHRLDGDGDGIGCESYG